MSTKDLLAISSKKLMNTYNRAPLVLVKGQGAKVWDSEGREYLDFLAGIAVCNIGHCHPKLTAAIAKQAATLIHVSNLFQIEPQIELARRLTELSFADRAFFCNSGAEANEAAIKLARKWAKAHKGPEVHEIISMEKSFHGRTMATASATGQAKVQVGFEPLLPGFVHVPFNDLEAVERAISPKTCAIMVEPIQGEGGVILPAEGYLPGLRQLAKRHNLLLIYDEVQVGMGRTGTLFAYEGYNTPPDIMTLAKSLAGGVPMGACLAGEAVADSFVPGSHASTFGGNPLACAAALATLAVIEEENVLENCRRQGEYLTAGLDQLKTRFPFIKGVRGRGLLIACVLDREAAPLVQAMREKGFLINAVQEKILRFVPPLIISAEEIDRLLAALQEVFEEVSHSS